MQIVKLRPRLPATRPSVLIAGGGACGACAAARSSALAQRLCRPDDERSWCDAEGVSASVEDEEAEAEPLPPW